MAQKTQRMNSCKQLLNLLLLSPLMVAAQVGIGTTSPDASAKLQIDATNQGLLPPRVSLTATSATSPVTAPAVGLLVYNIATAGTGSTAVSPGYYYYSGSAWIRLTVPTDNAANVTGTVAVANGGTGTSNGSITGTGALTFTAGGTNQDVTLTPSGTGKTILNGNVGVGTATPKAKLDVRTTPTSISDPGVGYVGIGTTAATAASAGAGALAYTNSTGGRLVYSNGTEWNTLQSTAQKAVVTGYFSGTYSSGGSTLTCIETSDASNVFSSNTFTAPRPGLYLITANLLTEAKTWDLKEELNISFRVNGSDILISSFFSQAAITSAYGGPTINAVVSMSAGDQAVFSAFDFNRGYTLFSSLYNRFSISEL